MYLTNPVRPTSAALRFAEVVRVGELVRIDGQWESIEGLISAALSGVRGGREKSRGPPNRMGQ